MKKRILEYIKPQTSIPNIVSSKKNIPDWYKKIPAFNANNIQFNGRMTVKSAKNCIPFFDGMTIGYQMCTWTDIYCYQQNGEPVFRWQEGPDIVESRDAKNNKEIPIPMGCSPHYFVWKNIYGFKAPKGYSLLITHPSNRYDLPFITLTGVVDADTVMPSGNIPFFIKNDFEGIIPIGTPIMQIIPFKRENWQVKENQNLLNEVFDQVELGKRKFFDYYKLNKWSRKNYDD